MYPVQLIFKAQNMGESVKVSSHRHLPCNLNNLSPCQIAIPYSLVADVDKSSAMDFSETLEVKVVDKWSNYSLDSYFFAYFQDLPRALEQIRELVRPYKLPPSRTSFFEVKDTTTIRADSSLLVHHGHAVDRTSNTTESKVSNFKFTSLFKPFTAGDEVADHVEPTLTSSKRDDFMHVNSNSLPIQGEFSSDSAFPGRLHPAIALPADLPPGKTILPTAKSSTENLKISTTHASGAIYDHTYPPPPSPGPLPPGDHQSSWNVSVPSWLRVPGRRIFGISNAVQTASPISDDRVHEVYSPGSAGISGDTGISNMGFSIIEAREAANDPDVVSKFRSSFALDDKETLLGCEYRHS